jgi:hypothetical protein
MLGTFAKLQNATTGFVLSVRVNTTWFPLDGLQEIRYFVDRAS